MSLAATEPNRTARRSWLASKAKPTNLRPSTKASEMVGQSRPLKTSNPTGMSCKLEPRSGIANEKVLLFGSRLGGVTARLGRDGPGYYRRRQPRARHLRWRRADLPRAAKPVSASLEQRRRDRWRTCQAAKETA